VFVDKGANVEVWAQEALTNKLHNETSVRSISIRRSRRKLEKVTIIDALPLEAAVAPVVLGCN